jgi:LmbE family N-acetylglucosaminyl deacetylase
MRYLYIFPHPDDESFGPAAAMYHQVKQGHEVHLLTLTRGEATKVRFELDLDKEAMGELRYNEMQNVQKVLGLSSLEVLRFPDSGLKELDPRVLEHAIKDHVRHIRPHVLVSYPVHGISGFHDHLVTHAVVKRTYLELREEGGLPLERLAFYTLLDRGMDPFEGKAFPVRQSTEDEIDCSVSLSEEDMEAFRKALDCYRTYQGTIQRSGVKERVDDVALFELFGENPEDRYEDLTQGLNG